jgi:hypothetical protein
VLGLPFAEIRGPGLRGADELNLFCRTTQAVGRKIIVKNGRFNEIYAC